jgi:hypothetical protein
LSEKTDGMSGRRWEDNIKMGLIKQIGRGEVNRMKLALVVSSCEHSNKLSSSVTFEDFTATECNE